MQHHLHDTASSTCEWLSSIKLQVSSKNIAWDLHKSSLKWTLWVHVQLSYNAIGECGHGSGWKTHQTFSACHQLMLCHSSLLGESSLPSKVWVKYCKGIYRRGRGGEGERTMGTKNEICPNKWVKLTRQYVLYDMLHVTNLLWYHIVYIGLYTVWQIFFNMQGNNLYIMKCLKFPIELIFLQKISNPCFNTFTCLYCTSFLL